MIMPVTTHRPSDWKYEPVSLRDMAVVLTGGSTGIGRATLRLLVAEGARVLTFARHEDELADAMAQAEGYPGEAHGMVADQAHEADIERVFDRARETFGSIDILINNAALPAGSVMDMTPSDIRYVIESNLLGYLQCSRLAIESMEERKGGHILNVGSMSADLREAGADVYVATKAAIAAFSEALRKQANDKGIRVTLLEPGAVGTDLGDTSPAKQRRKIANEEMLFAEDIAESIYFCLTQPRRCDVVSMQVRPHLQVI